MRAQITISKQNLLYNYSQIKKLSSKEVIAVVKSNAYGLGILEIASILFASGATFFAVATLEEAIYLRKNNIGGTILLLERTNEYALAYSYQITISIVSLSQIEDIKKSPVPVVAHLKIDTGMNRLGLSKDDIMVIKNYSLTNLKIKGVYSHIACESSFIEQEKVFHEICSMIPNTNNIVIHLCSSSYLHKSPSYTTHVRVGIALYGISYIKSLILKEVLSLQVPIVRRKSVKINEKVGYDLEGVIKEDGYLYTVSLGYADGWSKDRLTIAYKDAYLMQVGKTCMDYMMFFSKNKYEEGEYIEIISPSLPCQKMASIYSSTPYELLAALSYRIKRKIIT